MKKTKRKIKRKVHRVKVTVPLSPSSPPPAERKSSLTPLADIWAGIGRRK